MAIFELGATALVPLTPTALEIEGIWERRDLQRLLRTKVEVIAPGTMVLTEEFGDWLDSRRRIDLLAIDEEANLVVIELKRSDDGAMELQALRYAAMVSTLTFQQASDIHQRFRDQNGIEGPADQALLEFLKWDEPNEDHFARDVRVVLAAADFSKELTTSVMWLNRRGLDIRCVRMKPYRLDDRLLLDVQQVIPLPEAAEYQVQLRDKEESQKKDATRHSERRAFWTALLAQARVRTPAFASISPGPDNWVSATTGRPGLGWTYASRQHDCQVELYIDFGNQSQNEAAFDKLFADKESLETSFGAELDWQRLPERRGCRIRKVFEGGYKDPTESWPDIHRTMIDGMVRLQSTFGPRLSSL